jgi:DNA-binding response OmpR family regulator
VSTRTAALLIDDDARLAALVTEYLGQQGIDVTVAGDARLTSLYIRHTRPSRIASTIAPSSDRCRRGGRDALL